MLVSFEAYLHERYYSEAISYTTVSATFQFSPNRALSSPTLQDGTSGKGDSPTMAIFPQPQSHPELNTPFSDSEVDS